MSPHGFLLASTIARGTTYDGFSGQFFQIFEIIIFCFVVAMFDLVHNVLISHD